VSGPRVATSSDSACNPECGDACNYTVLSKNQTLPGLRALLPTRHDDQILDLAAPAIVISLLEIYPRLVMSLSRLQEPPPANAIYRKMKQYSMASSPWFSSGVKPRGACAMK
jgi:hypothetical protein